MIIIFIKKGILENVWYSTTMIVDPSLYNDITIIITVTTITIIIK